MTKKAQLLSHPFTVIFTLIVIALLLLFGFQQIRKLIDLNKAIETKQFETQLTATVQDVYTEPPGSNRALHITVPTAITIICFLDITKDLRTLPYPSVSDQAATLRDITTKPYNVFFIANTGEKTPDPLAIQKLQPTENICIPTEGTLNAVLENKGKTVTITQAL